MESLEWLEDPSLLVDRDSGAVVDDTQLNLTRAAVGDHANGMARRTRSGGVGQQVANDAFQEASISPHWRQIIWNVDLDLDGQ
jgi:hypothetical protein